MQPYVTPGSDRIAELGRRAIPAATINNWHAWVDENPIYLAYGQGARLYDIDGNEYIDYSLGHGPGVLGHSNAHVRQAIIEAAHRMYVPGVNELEVRAAQKIIEHIPCAELVTFTCSGTEANLGALRVARAYTGRDRYVRFRGHYHGGLDHIMGGIVEGFEQVTPVAGEATNDPFSRRTNTAGRYSRAFDPVYMLEWNDLPALERLFAEHASEIAAVLMEPVMVNNMGCNPEAGYLQGVHELCKRHGVALIFDEVLTGFRMGLGGAQAHFGVTPDLTTLGKAIGAGFPVSAMCGSRELMDTITRAEVVQGGTYNGHPMAMAAVIAAIEEYERDDGAVFKHIERVGMQLKEGLDQIAQEHEQPLLLQGFPGAWSYAFNPKAKIINNADGLGSDHEKAHRLSALMTERGVFLEGRFCMSAAHTRSDIEATLDVANEVIGQMKEDSA
jgi:glutamate-1-semialdehyde 2,1-aminomutase